MNLQVIVSRRFTFAVAMIGSLLCSVPSMVAQIFPHPRETQVLPLVKIPNQVNILILGDGYSDYEYDKFQDDAGRLQNTLTGQNYEPYVDYSASIHFFRYLERSPVSGIRHPVCSDPMVGSQGYFDLKSNGGKVESPARTVHTAYDLSYCYNQSSDDYLWPANTDVPLSHANGILPGVDIAIILANDDRWGGGSLHTLFTGNSGYIISPALVFIPINYDFAQHPYGLAGPIENVIAHEVGHGFLLEDERRPINATSQLPCDDTGTKIIFPKPPKCSANATNVLDPNAAKWRFYQAYGNSGITSTLYPGAINRPDYYGPAAACRMFNANLYGFCSVCRQGIIDYMHRRSRYVAGAPNPSALTELRIGQAERFSVNGATPQHGLIYTWKLNGQSVFGDTLENNAYGFTALAAGDYILSVTATDEKLDARGVPYQIPEVTASYPTPVVPEETVTWNIHVPVEIAASTGNDTNPVTAEGTITVPGGSPNPTLEYTISTTEPGGARQGDSWSIIVTNATTGAVVSPPLSGTVNGGDPIHKTIPLTIDTTHGEMKARGLDIDDEVSRMGDPVPPMFWFRDPTGHSLMVVELT